MIKESDLEPTIPVGTEVWGKNQHKPLLIFISLSPCAGTLPGVSRRPGTWLSFVGSCLECWKLCWDGRGLFCANFSFVRGYYSPCRKVWCRECYRTPIGLAFKIRTPKDEAGFKHVVDGDKNV
jgi:hypothetical protein